MDTLDGLLTDVGQQVADSAAVVSDAEADAGPTGSDSADLGDTGLGGGGTDSGASKIPFGCMGVQQPPQPKSGSACVTEGEARCSVDGMDGTIGAAHRPGMCLRPKRWVCVKGDSGLVWTQDDAQLSNTITPKCTGTDTAQEIGLVKMKVRCVQTGSGSVLSCPVTLTPDFKGDVRKWGCNAHEIGRKICLTESGATYGKPWYTVCAVWPKVPHVVPKEQVDSSFDTCAAENPGCPFWFSVRYNQNTAGQPMKCYGPTLNGVKYFWPRCKQISPTEIKWLTTCEELGYYTKLGR